jgi:hypothetical protein
MEGGCLKMVRSITWDEYMSMADCDYNNPDRCSAMIDQDIRSPVCFVCWYQFFAQPPAMPPYVWAQEFKVWKLGEDI